MNKVSAGVLAGLVLGSVQGALTAPGHGEGAALLLPILGRASQGIINGVLAAYTVKGKAPLWRGAVTGAMIGAGLGLIAGIPSQGWTQVVPASAAVGLGCGLAVARAAR